MRGLSDPLLADLVGDPDVARDLAPGARVQRLLDVEVALAEAEADLGVIPASAVPSIVRFGRADLYDPAAIAKGAAAAGNVAIPLIRAFTERIAATDPEAAKYVHWGATSQDVIDTATVLQLRDAIPRVLAHLRRAGAAAAGHARQHAVTPMAGRTWLQHATPTTFGLKAAGWLDALGRASAGLRSAADAAFVLQFGGASGTLAALGTDGPAVAAALATRLGLALPAVPWHAHRDRLSALGCALGVVAGTLGKIARDVSLLAQTEVGEAFEAGGEGRGGSSTMPHKRNPVGASVALAAAVRAPGLVATILGTMTQEHERGLGGWQAEWETLPELVRIVAGASRATADVLEGLVVDPARMRQNLDATGGLALAEAVAIALAPQFGRSAAHSRVEAATRRALAEHRPLAAVLAEDAEVTRVCSSEEIARRLTPEHYLGAAQVFVDRALAEYESRMKHDA